ncbi:MAG: carbon-nitrogen hydrolase [Deltaproteobacteria bacterium]|nr:carbon-nitrogen hydrolase [Deltaproteobacteria bacterium]
MSEPSPEVVLGLIQMSCVEEPRRNVEKAVEKARQAARDGAQIVCLQELFPSLYFCQTNDPKYFELAEPVPGPTSELLGKLAKELGVTIVASLFERDGKDYYNTACVLDADGRFLGKYRKVHIPDDPRNYYSELFYFKPGNLGIKPFATKFAKIGVQVCWDQWFPEGARSLALQGAEIIFYPTAIGWQVVGQEELGKAEYQAWETVQRGHAISNTVFVAAANRTGREDHLNFWGGSFVADPLGRVLKRASHDREENLIVPVDLKTIAEVRKDWPFLTCRRTEEYSL